MSVHLNCKWINSFPDLSLPSFQWGEGVGGGEASNTSSVSSKTAYSNICKTVQTRLRGMQDSWLSKKSDEIQSFADRKDMKKFFDVLKTVYRPQSSGTIHSLVQMELVFRLTKKLSWKDGLNTLMVSLIGHHLSMMKLSTDYHNVECNLLLDELPTVSETVKAIKPVIWQGSWIRCNTCRDLQSRRSSSCRDIELFHVMWRKEAIPQEFKDATIIHLFKGKRNPQVCDNHRGISLLSIAGMILARVLLNRLNEHLEQSGLLPESQCGFRKDRGTIDRIFTAWQLQEKWQEQNVDLYMPFVDLTKAVDTVSREGLDNYGKVWLSCQNHSNGAAVPWWNACKGPKWRVFWSIRYDKWS